MSRRSQLVRKRLLQRGQVKATVRKVDGITQKEMEFRDQRIPADAYAALSGMMHSARRTPSEDKLIRLAARYTGRR